jgi:hypothetical protein
MGWKWRRVINLGGGVRANMSRGGVGWSWGIPGLRIGKSPDGSPWLSVGIPGTGLYFTKYLTRRTSQVPIQPRIGENADTTAREVGIKEWKDLK